MAVYKDGGTGDIAELSRLRYAEREVEITANLLSLLRLYPLDEEQLTEIVHTEGITAIELCTLLSGIERKKMVSRGENGRYFLTKAGTMFLTEVSYGGTPLQKRLLAAADDVYARSQFDKAVRIKLTRGETGFAVTAAFLNEADGTPLLDITFHAKSEKTAAAAKENFVKFMKSAGVGGGAGKLLRDTLGYFM